MIVVTGPTGNVGAEVARLLVDGAAPGEEFRLAAHNPDKVRARLGQDVPVVPLEYDDRPGWARVFDGADKLFLLFPLPSPVNVDRRMTPFIDAAVNAGIKQIVYVSVPGADKYKFVPHYGVERHLERCGADYTILRCSYFMQNMCRWVSTHGEDVVRGEVFIPAGKGRTSFLDSRDVAKVAIDVLQKPDEHRNKGYVLTGTERLDYFQVAGILADVLGYPVRYTNPSLPHFWYRLARRGVTPDILGFMSIVYTLTRLGRNEPTTDELAPLLGRAPTGYRQFVQDYKHVWETRDWT